MLFQQIIALYSENIGNMYVVHVVYVCVQRKVRHVSAFITDDTCSDHCTLKNSLKCSGF